MNSTVANPTTPASMATIAIPQGMNILTFLANNHATFTTTPTRTGYTFMGWYLNAAFTNRVTATTVMPATNATMFARWQRLPAGSQPTITSVTIDQQNMNEATITVVGTLLTQGNLQVRASGDLDAFTLWIDGEHFGYIWYSEVMIQFGNVTNTHATINITGEQICGSFVMAYLELYFRGMPTGDSVEISSSIWSRRGIIIHDGIMFEFENESTSSDEIVENGNSLARVAALSVNEADTITVPPGHTTVETMTTFRFDNRNNRTSRIVTGAEAYTVTYTYDLNNRLTRKQRTGSNPAITTFTYDNNGNQLTQVTGNVTMTLTYDAFNHLIRVVNGSMTAVYTYRGDGLRNSKNVNGTETRHVWDRDNIILETANNGQVVNRFSRGEGHLMHSDHHGFYLFSARPDVIQRVTANGTILHTYRYDAFGNQLNGDETNTNPFRFAGEYYDWETGFIYLRARFFNPAIGRFISEDPHWNIHNMQSSVAAILQSSNLYTYCINNPVMWIDPSGRVIALPANKDDRAIVMQYLQMLTNHELFALEVDGRWHLAASLVDRSVVESSGNTWLGYGNDLILRMISSKHTVTIFLGHGERGFSAFGPACWISATTAGVGSGSSVRIRMDYNHMAITLDSAGMAVITYAPLHIVLAHELIHADRAMRGVLFRLDELGTTSFEVARHARNPANLWGNTSRTVTHTFQLEEKATIGVSHYTSNCITENMIRREHSLDRRISHLSRI